MRQLPLFIFAIIALFATMPMTAQARDNHEQERIDRIIHMVEVADVLFIRNGKSYSPDIASSHLRRKLFFAGSRIKTSDEFLHYIATKSFKSGKPYYVKLKNGVTMTAFEWITSKLLAKKQIVKVDHDVSIY